MITGLIGAFVGGFINGFSYGLQGKDFLQGFWRGAITGAIAGVTGFYAPIGVAGGFAYGAASGAVTGGVGAALNGTNIWKRVAWGSALGGVAGGITGGIEAKKLGADIWTGARPDHYLSTTEALVAGGTPAPYSNDYLYELKNENWKNIGPGGKMTMNGNPKNGATLIDGVLTDSNGKSAMALTQSSPWKHGTSSRMYFSRAAFSSREQLSVAMAHELGHLVFNNNAALFSMSNQVLSKTGLLNNEGHVALQNMTLKMINMNGWNQNLISNQVWKFDFQSRPLPQLESAIQFLIKNRIKFP